MRPPNAMDGIPAPISRLTSLEDSAISKEIILEVLRHDLLDEESSASAFWPEDMTWYGPVGFGLATNKQEYEQVFIHAIKGAFSERELKIDVLTCEGRYCGANGFLYGINTGDFLGEKASNLPVKLR